MKKKIGLYQSQSDYPSLHIIVTDNAVFLKERLAIADVEEALGKIREWLERNMK